jgi:hypothetical protein
MDDEILGYVTMRTYLESKAVNVSFDRNCMKHLTFKEIVFNYLNLSIKPATIDSNKTYKINWNKFSFGPRNIPNDDFVGKYEMYSDDDEGFYLTKIE